MLHILKNRLISQWTFWTTIISILIGLVGISLFFFYTKSPNLDFQILSSTPVFSIQENVDDLDVFFEGKNIREKGLGLTLFTIKMINTGDASIRNNDFDKRYPLSIQVKNGDLVDFEPLTTSEEYLSKILKDTVANDNKIVFPSFILEPGQFVSFRLLILHNDKSIPAISVYGKVTGTKKDITDISQVATPGLVNTALSGNIPVQLVRAFVYTIIVAIFLYIISRLIQRVVSQLLQKGGYKAGYFFEPNQGFRTKFFRIIEELPLNQVDKHNDLIELLIEDEQEAILLIDLGYATLVGISNIGYFVSLDKDKYLKNLKGKIAQYPDNNIMSRIYDILEKDTTNSKLTFFIRLVLFEKHGLFPSSRNISFLTHK